MKINLRVIFTLMSITISFLSLQAQVAIGKSSMREVHSVVTECIAIGDTVLIRILYTLNGNEDSASSAPSSSNQFIEPSGLPFKVNKSDVLNTFSVNGRSSKIFDDVGLKYAGKNAIKISIGDSGFGSEKTISPKHGVPTEGYVQITGVPDSAEMIKIMNLQIYRNSYGRHEHGTIDFEDIPIKR